MAFARRRRELQIGKLGPDGFADGRDLAAAEDIDGDEVAHDDRQDEDRADGDAGFAQGDDDVPKGLPATRAGVVGGLDQAFIDAQHGVEDRGRS